MRKLLQTLLLTVIALIIFSPRTHAQDGAFSDAQALQGGQLTLGIQPVIFTETDEFMLMLRTAYGIQNGFTLHGKVGLLTDETYAGGHFQYQLAGEPSSPLSFSLLGGVHSFGDVGLKTGGIISKQLNPFSLYAGLTYEPLFRDNNTLNALMLPVGVDIPLSGNTANFIMEANLAANDDGQAWQAVIFGINFYL
jgi:hypothetical protein